MELLYRVKHTPTETFLSSCTYSYNFTRTGKFLKSERAALKAIEGMRQNAQKDPNCLMRNGVFLNPDDMVIVIYQVTEVKERRPTNHGQETR